MVQHAAVGEEQGRIARMTEPGGTLDDRVEHRLGVGLRLRDGLQDLARRRLLLQGRRQRSILLLQLREHAYVVDRDGGLVGEGLQQRDLRVGERPHFAAQDRQAAERRAFSHERDFRRAVDDVDLQELEDVRVLGLGDRLNVVDHDPPAIEDRASPRELPGERQRQPHQPLHPGPRVRRVVEPVTVQTLDDGVARVAQTQCALGNGVEHGLQLGGRLRDDAQHVRGRGLAFQRIAKLAELACVLDRDDRLRREGLEHGDLPVGEGAADPT